MRETESCENGNKTADYFAAVCVLIGKASVKWVAKSMTVKINMLPDTVHGVNGPTMSTAILDTANHWKID